MEDPIPGLKGRFFVEQNDPDENFVEPKFMYKMVTFMVDLYHDGLFASNPLRLVLEKPLSFFYVLPGVPMNIGLRPICNDEQLNDFVQALFENNCHLDMYTEHQGYEVLEMINDDRHCEDKRKVGEGSSHKDLGKGSAGGSFDKGNGKLGKDRSEPSKNSIRSKFMINVSLGQCKRAKQATLFDHEGGLIDHYSKIWQYRQAVLDSNPGSTCHIDLEEKDDGLTYFKRIYLLTTMGRDANNQMFPIAWVVVGVENKNNRCWFLSLLSDDLNLNDGAGLIVISDGHKSGLQFKRLFWKAAARSMNEQFLEVMEEIKALDGNAYTWLVDHDPNTWCRAYFEVDRSCAAFENGISESFNSKILSARGKPIITMLEDIRVYIMKRVWFLNKTAMELNDSITPFARRHLEF
nr:hypothetical protein CTI12_AA159120 [Tanacetum cinerariifolium]